MFLLLVTFFFTLGMLIDFLSAYNVLVLQKGNKVQCFWVSFTTEIVACVVALKLVDSLLRGTLWQLTGLVLAAALGSGIGDIVALRLDRWMIKASNVKRRRGRKKRGKKGSEQARP